MYIIVGLGNPGKEYERTRHNLGFLAVEEIAKTLGLKDLKSRLKSMTGEATYEGHKVIIAEPQTFMNLSGQAVTQLLSWYKVPSTHLIVIYDDVDLEIGAIKIRPKGSAGGHHGIESIIKETGTSDFIRIKVGIGRDNVSGDVSNYVLQNIPVNERDALAVSIQKASVAALAIVEKGIEPAMNLYNAS